jgi:hypothetical protein
MKWRILCWLPNALGFTELRFSSLEIFGSERRPPWWTHVDPHRNTGYKHNRKHVLDITNREY